MTLENKGNEPSGTLKKKKKLINLIKDISVSIRMREIYKKIIFYCI